MTLRRLRVGAKVLTQTILGPCGIVPDETFARLQYLVTFGRLPDLANPKTFNEHISARKIRPAAAAFAPFTDKYSVRDFVSERVGSEYLVTLLGVYESVDDVPWAELPAQCVAKCSHGSSYNIVFTLTRPVRWQLASRKLGRWLRRDYYRVGREVNYRGLQPRVLVEAFLGDELDELKLFCFEGRVAFIQHNCAIDGERRSNLYDSDWNQLSVRYGYAGFPADLRDEVRAHATELAKKLSAGFDFVRVDLYVVRDLHVYFGELTFNPGGGLIPFYPSEADRDFGGLFEASNFEVLNGWRAP